MPTIPAHELPDLPPGTLLVGTGQDGALRLVAQGGNEDGNTLWGRIVGRYRTGGQWEPVLESSRTWHWTELQAWIWTVQARPQAPCWEPGTVLEHTHPDPILGGTSAIRVLVVDHAAPGPRGLILASRRNDGPWGFERGIPVPLDLDRDPPETWTQV